MSVLIKGMEMPEKGHILSVVIKDGKVIGANTGKVLSKEVIELPPHGRLIDADALHIQLIDKELDQLQPWTSFDDYREVLQMIDDAPTIIESEEEE